MGLIEIAEHARSALKAFPWDRLGVPAEEGIFDIRYRDVLKESYLRVAKMTMGLDLVWDLDQKTEETKRAMAATDQTLLSNENVFRATVNANAKVLANDVTLDREILRVFITRTFMSYQEACSLFLYAVPQQGIPKFSDVATCVNALDRCYALGEALLLLESTGALDPIKKAPKIVPWMRKAGTFGAVQAPVLVAGVVLSVMMFALFAWFLLEWKRISALKDLANQICRDALSEPDEKRRAEKMDLCKKAGAALEKATKAPLFGDLGAGLGVGLAILAAFLGLRLLRNPAK